MKKIFHSIYRLTQVLVVLVCVLSLSSVNTFSSNSKVVNDTVNKTLDLTAMSTIYDEMLLSDIYYPLDTFTGDLTGYAADCPLCGGTLGCTGQNVLVNRTTTYDDSTYGNVRIVASSKNLPCGSIVRFNLSSISSEPVYAIVLDRGVLGNDLDLLMESEDSATKLVGRRKTTYDVLRFGWTRAS